MVIPWVKVVWISDHKGYGLFADRFIPKGTITFAQDGLDIVISNQQLETVDPILRENVEKYSYEDYMGNRIVSWDLGKYMNHDDRASTLSTGYGFEIAVRDIQKGEEVTDDYRIFSTHHDTTFTVPVGSFKDFTPWGQDLIDQWDVKVKEALAVITEVDQPLKDFIDTRLWSEVLALKKSTRNYRSVSTAFPLRYKLLTEGRLPEKSAF
ncbi:MAG: SET domain-containing protein [Bdellovibrionales bacterium]|nr:SET domain-containing protein [Bdellovibrionales bacterium]